MTKKKTIKKKNKSRSKKKKQNIQTLNYKKKRFNI